MSFRRGKREESGVSLVEMLIALAIFSIVVVAVDSSLTVVQERQVQVSNSIEGLDTLQDAQEAITTDIHAANVWTDPALPTTAPGSPVTATLLVFSANLNGATEVGIGLNTTTHVLQVCQDANTTTPITVSSVCTGTGIRLQAKVSNIDSSSLFTFTTNEVSTTVGTVTTNTFFYTSVASTVILDARSTVASQTSPITLSSPTIVVYDGVYGCQTALAQAGATGSC